MMRCQLRPTVGLAVFCVCHSAGAQLDQPFPAVLDQSFFDGTGGFAANAGDARGGAWSVAHAGDVNGDGIDDVIIGDGNASPSGINRAGEAYVIFGGTGVGSSGFVDLSALDGTNGFVIRGFSESQIVGASVSSAGDVNADGHDDLVIGRWFPAGSNPNSETQFTSYVVFGGPGVGASGVIELSGVNGTNGFVVQSGIVGAWDGGFTEVASIGDVNNDGIDDIAFGAQNANFYTGVVYVVFGQPGIGATGTVDLSGLDGTNGFTFSGVAEESVGSSIDSAGDLNGDGIGDLIIGAEGFIEFKFEYPGGAHVIFGANDVGSVGSMIAADLDGSNGFSVIPLDNVNNFDNDGLGVAVASAGDINSDGMADLLIGANYVSGGETYVVFGGPSIGSTGSLEVSSLDGSNGFSINAVGRSDQSGSAAAGAGDINGDGVDDMVIGAWAASRGRSGTGESYVVFGGPDVGVSGDFELDSIDGSNGFILRGWEQYQRVGRCVSSAGDINDDGMDDVIIGSVGRPPETLASYIVFGRDVPPPCVADTNGDGMLAPNDFNAWILAFNMQSAACDQNGDGQCAQNDFNAWVLNFNAGCG